MMYDSMAGGDGRYTKYGMGWRSDFHEGYWSVYHGGNQEGTTALLLRLPWQKFALAILCNNGQTDLYGLANYVIGKIFDTHRIGITAETKHEKALYNALYKTWLSGLGYFDRFKSSVPNEKDELEKSFHFLKILFVALHRIETWHQLFLRVREGFSLLRI